MNSLKNIAVACMTVASLFGSACASAQSGTNVTGSSAKETKKAVRAQNRLLAKNVQNALHHNKNLTSGGISVLARNGAVTLGGNVPSEDQIQVAGDTASRVAGVTSVNNNILVREGGH
jgi:hyperosmotically inducible periplasmic protein